LKERQRELKFAITNLMSSLKKLQKIIFYLLIFLIPCNLAKHWPQSWSYVSGILVDYLIPTLYVTDILIITLLILWLLEKRTVILSKAKDLKSTRFRNPPFRRARKFAITIISIFLLYTLYSILYTKNLSAAFYKLIKIIEFSLLIIYISSQGRSTFGRKTFIQVLSLSVLWQSVLAIAQWFKQASVFGYWFFGEQPYNASTLGIKMINWFGSLRIPSYGTFTHPNVLAGFLVINLIITLNYKLQITNYKKNSIFNLSNKNLRSYILDLTSLILGTVALFLTFSFASWLVLIIYLLLSLRATAKQSPILDCFVLPLSGTPRNDKTKLLIYCVTGLLIFLLIKFIDPESLTRRFKLTEIAIKMWLSSPLFGVGLNNFIPRMEEFGNVVTNYRFLQPVHNVFLLVLSETGAIGVFSILYLVFRVFSKRKISSFSPSILYTLYSILFLGLFDHYFLTLQQGMLLLALTLGFIF